MIRKRASRFVPVGPRAGEVAHYVSGDSSKPGRTYAPSTNPPGLGSPMTRSTKISRGPSRALAAIGVRALEDAHMTWIAAEVESGHALHAWFKATRPSRAAAFLAYRAAADREEAAARDLQRLSELTQPCQERLARTE